MSFCIVWAVRFKKVCFSPIFRVGQGEVPSLLFSPQNILIPIYMAWNSCCVKINRHPVPMVQSVSRNTAYLTCYRHLLYVGLGWAIDIPRLRFPHRAENLWLRHREGGWKVSADSVGTFLPNDWWCVSANVGISSAEIGNCGFRIAQAAILLFRCPDKSSSGQTSSIEKVGLGVDL